MSERRCGDCGAEYGHAPGCLRDLLTDRVRIDLETWNGLTREWSKPIVEMMSAPNPFLEQMLRGWKPQPLTRRQLMRLRWLQRWWRVRDAWAVLRGRAGIGYE